MPRWKDDLAWLAEYYDHCKGWRTIVADAIGLTPGAIGHWLHGRSAPGAENAHKLADLRLDLAKARRKAKV